MPQALHGLGLACSRTPLFRAVLFMLKKGCKKFPQAVECPAPMGVLPRPRDDRSDPNPLPDPCHKAGEGGGPGKRSAGPLAPRKF